MGRRAGAAPPSLGQCRSWAMSAGEETMSPVSDQGTDNSQAEDATDAAELYARWQELADQVRAAREAYYGQDTQLISDAAFDELLAELQGLERQHPVLRQQDSPTREVGPAASALFSPVPHAEQMLSLDNVFSAEELHDWLVKTQEAAGRTLRWLCELKIAGLAMSLRYGKGRLVSAATRGDGRIGEDVTQNAVHVADSPQRLAGTGHPDLVEVRGEVFIPTARFTELNELQAELQQRAVADARGRWNSRSEEHTSELQSRFDL